MKTILIIREFDNFSRILAANDFEIVTLPLIETKSVDDLSDFRVKLDLIENYDGIFVTSQYATQVLFEELNDSSKKFSGKIYVLGKRSFEILKNGKFKLFYAETANNAQEMLENIGVDELKNKRLLFVRGEKSLRIVPDFLSKFANIEEAIVYQTMKINLGIDMIKAIREKFFKNQISCVCFFSPSAAESFLEQFDAKILHQTKIAAIGKTTADYFERRNLSVSFVSSKASAEDFAVELIEYLTNGKWKMENGK